VQQVLVQRWPHLERSHRWAACSTWFSDTLRSKVRDDVYHAAYACPQACWPELNGAAEKQYVTFVKQPSLAWRRNKLNCRTAITELLSCWGKDCICFNSFSSDCYLKKTAHLLHLLFISKIVPRNKSYCFLLPRNKSCCFLLKCVVLSFFANYKHITLPSATSFGLVLQCALLLKCSTSSTSSIYTSTMFPWRVATDQQQQVIWYWASSEQQISLKC